MKRFQPYNTIKIIYSANIYSQSSINVQKGNIAIPNGTKGATSLKDYCFTS